MLDAHARRQSLDRRLENVVASLDLVRDREETLSSPAKQLLSELDRLVTFARTAIEHRWVATEGFREPGRELSRRITCDDFRTLLIALSDTLLPVLEGSESSRIPVEMEPLVGRLVQEAGGGSFNVVLFSDDSFNYSIQRYPEPVLYLAPKIAPRMPPPAPNGNDFLFLRLPRLERDSAALHTVILGHELGHLRDWNHNISGSLRPVYPGAWLDTNGLVRPECVGRSALFLEVTECWASEIVADIYGALLFGPATLTSLAEIVLSLSGLAHESVTHPSTHRRAAIILRVLDQQNFDSIPDITTILAAYRSECSPRFDDPVKLHRMEGAEDTEAAQAAWDWLKTQVDALIVACSANIGGSTSTDSSIWPEVLSAADCLTSGRPCGEKLVTHADTVGLNHQSLPVGADVILNAAWHVRNQDFGSLGAILARSPAEPGDAGAIGTVLDGLVLKSLEIAELRRTEPWEWHS